MTSRPGTAPSRGTDYRDQSKKSGDQSQDSGELDPQYGQSYEHHDADYRRAQKLRPDVGAYDAVDHEDHVAGVNSPPLRHHRIDAADHLLAVFEDVEEEERHDDESDHQRHGVGYAAHRSQDNAATCVHQHTAARGDGILDLHSQLDGHTLREIVGPALHRGPRPLIELGEGLDELLRFGKQRRNREVEDARDDRHEPDVDQQDRDDAGYAGHPVVARHSLLQEHDDRVEKLGQHNADDEREQRAARHV